MAVNWQELEGDAETQLGDRCWERAQRRLLPRFPRPISPGKILGRPARRSAIVAHLVRAWEAGDCTWDEAMMLGVEVLEQENFVLRELIAGHKAVNVAPLPLGEFAPAAAAVTQAEAEILRTKGLAYDRMFAEAPRLNALLRCPAGVPLLRAAADEIEALRRQVAELQAADKPHVVAGEPPF